MPAELTSLLRIEVPVIVQIGSRRMLMRDVLALAPGAIIELPKDSEKELELLVNNKRIGRGRAVKVGENFGIRLTQIGNASQTLQMLRSDGHAQVSVRDDSAADPADSDADEPGSETAETTDNADAPDPTDAEQPISQ